MYVRPDQSQALTQGDLIDNCPVFYLPFEESESTWESPLASREKVLVLTQACDLANSKTQRVQVAIVHPAERLVDQGIFKPAAIRDNVRRHRVFGWYFLPTGDHVRESLVDLRDLHTVQRKLLEHLISNGNRVARLATPYREHLAQHFAITYMRIGLPEDYPTEE